MYIIIVGAGQVGYYLTKTLLDEGYEVTLVDWNYDRVQLLEQELGEVVIYASGSSITGLEKAGCSRADVIVAVTGDDEDNLVISQLGKRYFQVPKAIARINNPKNENIFNELGIGTTISGTTSIVDAIEGYVAKKKISTLLTFDHNEMALVELELPEEAPVVNRRISEIALPYECLIALILRGRDVLFAKGDTLLQANDLIIAISTQSGRENLREVLLGKTGEGQ